MRSERDTSTFGKTEEKAISLQAEATYKVKVQGSHEAKDSSAAEKFAENNNINFK